MTDDRLPDWPRGLGESRAAAYVGLSVNTFRRAVDAADAPAPVWLTTGRKVWLRDHLDAWLDRKAAAGVPSPGDGDGDGAAGEATAAPHDDGNDWLRRLARDGDHEPALSVGAEG